jgi:hypothetical protein
MSSSSIASNLLNIAEQYSFYTTLIILILGFIGNIINIIVFINLKIFRKNQCSFYLIIESLVNIIQLIFLFLTRILIIINNGIDPANQSLLWCKLRTVIGQPITLLSFSIVCFAAYDQFLSTSHQFNLRQMSTYELAQYLTLTALCFYMIHSIPFAIFLDINPSSGCAVYNQAFNRYYQFFYYPILVGILPVSISSFFSFLAFRNVRRLIRREISIVRRRLDRELTAMILVRTVTFIILVLPYTIHHIYWLQISIFQEELMRYAIDSLILIVMVSLLNLNFGVR